MRNWINVVEMYGGARSFPGHGLRLFRPKMRAYIAGLLHSLDDAHIREFLTDWFIKLLSEDDATFDAAQFRKMIENPLSVDVAGVRFQARHYYYLAHYVKDLPNENAREFVCVWLADRIGRAANKDFNMSRWKEYCGLEITPLEKKLSGGIRRKHVHGYGYQWPDWYQEYLDDIGEYHDPRTGERG